ncbi:GFA family protein [Amphritea balenae]|uniref:GFA family protein n=1 Tax=Amphritea balenae TaxID=452629 RepID=A0A3P1SQ28_9GAMM|nr:GFA family protein [Amphritea balenae]RRC99361.1 GFA family protein [Amphritea balenae]GGK71760.1 alanine acetyltransferase [Amphritea balenae]
MQLEGTCHCGSVHFTVYSPHPYPFNQCYCSICRKTAGGGGYAINLGADYKTLKIDGEDNISVYQATVKDPETGEDKASPARRHFCQKCGSALWVWDPRWPELVHPFASAIDTDLPVPPERSHMMLDSKAGWVAVQEDSKDNFFKQYPQESLADWHRRLGLEERDALQSKTGEG